MPVGIVNSSTAAIVAAPLVGALDTTQVGGNFQNGCFPEPSLPYSTPFFTLRVQQLPSVARCILPTGGVTRVGETECNQYQVVLHVGDSLMLAPQPADDQNVETAFVSPAGNIGFLFSSRQIQCVTCSTTPNQFSSTCVLTAVSQGITTVEVVAPRAVNSVFPTATPSPSAGGSGLSLIVRVTP